MKPNKYLLCAAAVSFSFVSAASAQSQMNGELIVNTVPENSSWSATSLTLNAANFVTGSYGTFAALVPDTSELGADADPIVGLSTTPTPENIPDFFVFANLSSPPFPFAFDLTSLTDDGGGSFTGSGTVRDLTGGFANTPGSFTIAFSSSSDYSITINATAVPEPTTFGLLAAGLVGALTVRELLGGRLDFARGGWRWRKVNSR